MLLFLLINGVVAQNSMISEIVIDSETKKSIAGASAAVKDDQNGAITGADGTFSQGIRVNITIMVSSAGYINAEYRIDDRSNITKELKKAISSLEDFEIQL